MSIAVIENNVVINLVSYNESNLQSSIEHLESKGYTCVVSIVARIGDTWDGVNFIPPEEPEVPTEPEIIVSPYEWFIDIGPFFDRFGAKKLSILMSDDSLVKAIIQDAQIRKWIDLQKAEVSQALDILISKNLINANDKTSILTTPVSANEQSALKKQYFL